MKKILFSLIVLVALNSASYASNCNNGDHTAGHSHEDDKATGLSSGIKSENIIDVATNGMVCDFCARGISKTFKKDENVKKISIDLKNGKVVIAYQNDYKISFDDIKEKMLENGINAVKMEIINI